ncbi:3 beta-hydroxysteroid dehydrogenase/delta 5--_4-isomerase [mine drainage metagenome]|uniref:3 beta-hydroxysteroid dehydrogenase/delta 5-->4-isomerase n=1 Tax=mine drainage metagenome TaxID=410659 RepID=A0A1J5R6Q1_9ZZZZ
MRAQHGRSKGARSPHGGRRAAPGAHPVRALVTGANGLIGSNLVRELRQHQWQVRAMVRASSRLDALEGTDVKRVVGDVLQPAESLVPLMEGCDVVFHTAAHFAYAGFSPAQLEQTAVGGTRHVLEAAASAGVRRVVITSSSVVFGSSPTPFVRDETAALGHVNVDGFVEPPYVASKVKQDRLAADLGRSLGIEMVFVCPTMTMGAHATTLGPSNGLIVAYLADSLRMTYPGGCNIVSARDVAAGHRLAALHGAAGEHYLLGGDNLTWQQVHALIAELCGVEAPRVRINHTMAYCAATLEEMRAELQRRAPLTTRDQARMVGRYYWYSHAKAAAIGFAPTPARAALAWACAWLAASSHISRELRTTMLLSADVHAARAAQQSGRTA